MSWVSTFKCEMKRCETNSILKHFFEGRVPKGK